MLGLLNSRAALGHSAEGQCVFLGEEGGCSRMLSSMRSFVHPWGAVWLVWFVQHQEKISWIGSENWYWNPGWLGICEGGAAVLWCLWDRAAHLGATCALRAGRPQRNWAGLGSGLPFCLVRLGLSGSQTLWDVKVFPEGLSGPVLHAPLLGPRCLEAPGWSSASQRRFQI